MAHPNLSGAFRGRCPQEVIDLILDKTDKETLKSCALVAHSFQPTSQKLLFADLTILPPGHDSIPVLQRLADVLSASSCRLAKHVRTLHLFQYGLYEPCVWMQSDILPIILSMLTELKSLNVRIYNWDYFHMNCEQAIYALISRSSLSSIGLKEARLHTNPTLLSLLRSLPTSLKSVSFLNVFANNWSYRRGEDLDKAFPALHQLHLASLHLDSLAPALFDWANRVVDLECIRHLHTTVGIDTMEVLQQLLDGAVYVETYHLSLRYTFSHDQNPNLEKMQGLRTLEISVELDWDEIEEVGGEGQHNPLNDAMRVVDTASHTVEHLILNLRIWDPDELSHFMESAMFEHLGDRSVLRDVVVRIESSNDYSVLQRGIQYLEAVFYQFHERGMLTAVAVRPTKPGG